MNSKYTSCVKAAYNKYGQTINAKYNYPEDSYTFFEHSDDLVDAMKMDSKTANITKLSYLEAIIHYINYAYTCYASRIINKSYRVYQAELKKH